MQVWTWEVPEQTWLAMGTAKIGPCLVIQLQIGAPGVFRVFPVFEVFRVIWSKMRKYTPPPLTDVQLLDKGIRSDGLRSRAAEQQHTTRRVGIGVFILNL